MINNTFADKRILVTGACGTVGSELVNQLLSRYRVGEVVAIDNNETALFFLEQELSSHTNVHFCLGDVRDRDKLLRRMRGIDIVFHTAAFKHVVLCERSPFEAVQTNILGVQNIIWAALENEVKKVIFTSSDKAVNPTNVMGTSKLMGERLMTAANCNSRAESTIFSSTRFGNVLGSRGSVIPVFRKQISQGGPVTLTHPNMTRFIMSIQDAVQLVIDSAAIAKGGEVFVTKMPVIRIQDLAQVMIEELAHLHGHSSKKIAISTIGVKPGEKMYEELMTHEETRRCWELSRYYVIFPAFSSFYRPIVYDYVDIVSTIVEKAYNSANETPMNHEQIKGFLRKNNLIYT